MLWGVYPEVLMALAQNSWEISILLNRLGEKSQKPYFKTGIFKTEIKHGFETFLPNGSTKLRFLNCFELVLVALCYQDLWQLSSLKFWPQWTKPKSLFWLRICCSLFASFSRSHSPLKEIDILLVFCFPGQYWFNITFGRTDVETGVQKDRLWKDRRSEGEPFGRTDVRKGRRRKDRCSEGQTSEGKERCSEGQKFGRRSCHLHLAVWNFWIFFQSWDHFSMLVFFF